MSRVGVAFIVAGIAYAVYTIYGNGNSSLREDMLLAREVPVSIWKSDDCNCTAWAVARGEPVVLRGTCASSLDIIDAWTTNGLAALDLPLKRARRRSNSVGDTNTVYTLWRTPEEMPTRLNTTDRSDIEYIDVDSSKFSAPADGDAWYFAGLLDELPSLSNQVNVTSWHFRDAGMAGKGFSRSVLWYGTRGVTAQLHFDRSHNFFIHVSGWVSTHCVVQNAAHVE